MIHRLSSQQSPQIFAICSSSCPTFIYASAIEHVDPISTKYIEVPVYNNFLQKWSILSLTTQGLFVQSTLWSDGSMEEPEHLRYRVLELFPIYVWQWNINVIYKSITLK